MKIVQLTPGAGGTFYCENCLRDISLVKAIRSLGHDILMVPMYLPVEMDGDEKGLEKERDVPVFFGGINVYLQQKFSFFRRTPRWLDWLFDGKGLLRLVGKMASMTSAEDLAETTISMLRGEDGLQKKELDRLVGWLLEEGNRPDVICLSNVMLAGFAGELKRRVGRPVVCMLQDEDGFLDDLTGDYSERCWEVLCEKAGDVDAFISSSDYYAGVMRERLGVDGEKIFVVPAGVDVSLYGDGAGASEGQVIGFLSQMAEVKGLGLLVDAFIRLKGDERFGGVKLRVAGGASGADAVFVEGLKQRLLDAGCIGDVEFLAGFDLAGRVEFLKSLTVLSVPEVRAVSYGLYAIEANACGVAVAEPDSGVFVEMVEKVGGGVLFKENDVGSLAQALESLLLDPAEAVELGQKGRQGVVEHYNVYDNAAKMVAIFRGIVEC